MAYSVTEEQKKQFAAIYVLDQMVSSSLVVPLLLEDRDRDLEPVIEYLMMKGYVDIHNNECYRPADKGREVLDRFTRRYRDFLINFDVYCAVDLAAGEFAFARYFEFDTDEQWQEYLGDERWDDLRVPVAVFKKLDPVEIVFMSFLREGRFGRREEGWQFDLLLGTVWDRILEICDTAIVAEDLAYTADDGEEVSGEAVLADVIEQGAELNAELRQEELAQRSRPSAHDEDAEPDDIDDAVRGQANRYHEDPRYVAPWWGTTVFL